MSAKQPVDSKQAGSDAASRFGYLGSDVSATSGGVRTAGGKQTGGGPAGVPGPAERRLDVSEMARTVGMRYTHRFHIPPYAAEGVVFAAPLRGEITLSNTGGVLLLRGQVAAELELECVRCLERFAAPVETDLEEEFSLVTTRNAYHQEEVQAVDEDAPASVIEHNVLDLGELLRQNLLLAAPLQPLCREDCPGVDLGGRSDVSIRAPGESGDSPLRRLGELLAARENEDSPDDAGETQER